MLYHGNVRERRILFSKILRKHKVGNKKAFPVVITSFQIPLRDKNTLKKLDWYYLIIDEGHRLKNHHSLLLR